MTAARTNATNLNSALDVRVLQYGLQALIDVVCDYFVAGADDVELCLYEVPSEHAVGVAQHLGQGDQRLPRLQVTTQL